MMHRFLAPARAELEDAFDHYEARRPGLGVQFATEVQTAIDRIVELPLASPRISPSCRRFRIARFPYGVIYQIRPDHIVIVAVAHLRRDPSYWRDRAEP
jgi:plasmid stabilization system protein ParE